MDKTVSCHVVCHVLWRDVLFFLFVSLLLTLKVTLSYGWFENKMNSVELKGVFTKDEDPSRLVMYTPHTYNYMQTLGILICYL